MIIPRIPADKSSASSLELQGSTLLTLPVEGAGLHGRRSIARRWSCDTVASGSVFVTFSIMAQNSLI